MAYFKIDHKQDGRYIRIVKSKRREGKVIKETVYSLGRVEDYTPEQLKRFGERFYELGGGDPRELLSRRNRELGRYNYGYYQLYHKTFLHYGVDQLLGRIAHKHQVQFNLTHAVLLMLLERLTIRVLKTKRVSLPGIFWNPAGGVATPVSQSGLSGRLQRGGSATNFFLPEEICSINRSM